MITCQRRQAVISGVSACGLLRAISCRRMPCGPVPSSLYELCSSQIAAPGSPGSRGSPLNDLGTVTGKSMSQKSVGHTHQVCEASVVLCLGAPVRRDALREGCSGCAVLDASCAIVLHRRGCCCSQRGQSCNLQGWLSRLWQIGTVVMGAAVVALAVLKHKHEGAHSGPESELMMEGRSKRTPENSPVVV